MAFASSEEIFASIDRRFQIAFSKCFNSWQQICNIGGADITIPLRKETTVFSPAHLPPSHSPHLTSKCVTF